MDVAHHSMTPHSTAPQLADRTGPRPAHLARVLRGDPAIHVVEDAARRTSVELPQPDRAGCTTSRADSSQVIDPAI